VGLFRRKRADGRADPEVFVGLRSQLFGVDAASLGIEPTEDLVQVWGGVMELGMPEGAATIVSLADGTTSMYLSTGGGVIGGGEHEHVAAASIHFLHRLEGDLDQLPPDESIDLPDPDSVTFYAFTHRGRRRREEAEQALSSEDHPLFSLYAAGHGVITALRETATARDR
jgi:hypothetical protein